MSGTYISEYSCEELIKELLDRCETEVIANGRNPSVLKLQGALKTYQAELLMAQHEIEVIEPAPGPDLMSYRGDQVHLPGEGPCEDVVDSCAGCPFHHMGLHEYYDCSLDDKLEVGEFSPVETPPEGCPLRKKPVLVRLKEENGVGTPGAI